ncbi:MAG: hypothetical protein ACRDTM_16245 [Micromonosporaceae bacterium]
MAKVFWHTTMSLDGFIAGPGGDMDRVFAITAPNPVGKRVVPTIGAIVTGRRTHDPERADTTGECGQVRVAATVGRCGWRPGM